MFRRQTMKHLPVSGQSRLRATCSGRPLCRPLRRTSRYTMPAVLSAVVSVRNGRHQAQSLHLLTCVLRCLRMFFHKHPCLISQAFTVPRPGRQEYSRVLLPLLSRAHLLATWVEESLFLVPLSGSIVEQLAHLRSSLEQPLTSAVSVKTLTSAANADPPTASVRSHDAIPDRPLAVPEPNRPGRGGGHSEGACG